MAKSIGYSCGAFLLWLAMAATANAQAVVEYGLGAARAATTTAPAAGIGKTMNGLAGSLDKALKAGQPASKTQSVATAPSGPRSKASTVEPPTPPAPAVKWEDPSEIQTGLSYDEMVRRFGPPALEITGEMGKSIVYSSKAASYHIEIQDGQVASVRKSQS